jgi:hypothetical protein
MSWEVVAGTGSDPREGAATTGVQSVSLPLVPARTDVPVRYRDPVPPRRIVRRGKHPAPEFAARLAFEGAGERHQDFGMITVSMT